MSAAIIDGKALAATIRSEVRETIHSQGLHPTLAVVLVGADPASQVYVRNKTKACVDADIACIEKRLPDATSQDELLTLIRDLNTDDAVDGILVQLPLPKHIDSDAVIAAIHPEKDVDGFHVVNAGCLVTGGKGFVPCTPAGVMRMIASCDYDLCGKQALVIGRSNIVGKPMGLLLLQKNATVTIAHSRTSNLRELARQADIIVAAVGKAKLVTKDMVKPGAMVIDVGMNRDAQGKLCGDVDTGPVSEIAGWITTVPGGVGPMTIAMLLSNTLEAHRRRVTHH